ncbi:MAB_1171c family putative transporter [Streptomyces sp. NPDC057011]|uniref:MAB_1171c family putative transporter n=1 Tax=unclassified Streptomyces TaxID=2593676 RepID=UPI00363E54BF
MSTTAGYICSATFLFMAMLLKLRALRRNPQDNLLRALCALLGVAGLLFATSAPPMQRLVNAWTGVPNLATPLVYAGLLAVDCAIIVLLIHWRGGEDPTRIRRATRWCILAYGSVIAVIAALFAMGDAPVERLRDLDTYYATTPWIREMNILYLVAHSFAAFTLMVLCRRWSRQVSGIHRFGLLIIAVGNAITLAYAITRYTAIGARWAGLDWDWPSTQSAFSHAGIGAFFMAGGFLLPPVGREATCRWTNYQRFQLLRPLWEEIQPEIPPTSRPPLHWWNPMGLRLMQRERDIHDAVLRLSPYFDAVTGRAVYRQAVAQNTEERQAASEADAAVIAHAVRTKSPDTQPLPVADRWTVSSTDCTDDLLSVSSALASSALVKAARNSVAPTTPGCRPGPPD